jgi:carbon-monoxide dehydrogenase medium subunit
MVYNTGILPGINKPGLTFNHSNRFRGKLMPTCQQYLQPQTLSEAIESLSAYRGRSAVIAGGTDLLLDLQQGRHHQVEALVDISGVAEMSRLEEDGDSLYLGAAVTHKQIVSSPLMLTHARCVVEGAGLIGGPQVRNVATIGGNVSHALPAGDGTISLLAMDTEVEIASPDGNRWEPLIEIFAGPGKVTFDRESELVAGFRFRKRGPREGSAFHRVMRPQGVAIAILNMAGWVRLDDKGALADIRIAVGPAGPKPFRAFETEAYLQGKALNEEIIEQASAVLDREVSLRTSRHRATKEYRHALLPVLLKTVLPLAVSRASEN